MITRTSAAILRACQHAVKTQRHLTVTPVVYAAQATDPIQQMFLDKVRTYAKKSKESGGKLVDATAETETKFQQELDRIEKQFGKQPGEDFTKFPTFNFQDTELELPSVNVDTKPDAAAEAAEEQEEDDTPFFHF